MLPRQSTTVPKVSKTMSLIADGWNVKTGLLPGAQSCSHAIMKVEMKRAKPGKFRASQN